MDISVVIPLYNKRETILQTLESVLNQRSKPIEVVVVNDGSTDGSEQLVAELNHSLIRLINQSNGGVSAARNKGIEVSHGDWIAFLDADDEWLPDYLETIKKLNSDYPEVKVLGTAYLLQDYKGNRKRIKLNKIPFHGEEGLLSNYFEVASCSHPPFCSSSVVIQKGALIAVGGFPIGIKSGEDLLTWSRLAVRNKIAYHREAFSVYHQQLANIGSSFYREQISDIIGDALILNMQYCPEGLLMHYKQYLSRWFKSKAQILIEIGECKLARRKIISSWKNSNEKHKLFFLFLLTLFGKEFYSILQRIR